MIEISYINISGIANKICDTTSGGVSIADIVNIIIIAYLRLFIKL